MDGESDPISELRETLRTRPAMWEPERTPRRLPAFPRISRLTRISRLRPDVRIPHLDINWRRAAGAISRTARSARPFVVAVVVALRAAGRSLWAFGRWSVATAARVRLRRAVEPAAIEPTPLEPTALAVAADDGARHLEDLERRQLEQRIEALGSEHPDVAILLQLVAERCAVRGAPDEALALYGRALRIQEAAFGPDSPALRPLLGDLAALELELGHDGDALLHRARRDMLERRSAAAADGIRLGSVVVSRTSDQPNGVSRVN
jgi:hypothetical protein